MKHENQMHILCENLRTLRQCHGLTRQQMAEILGISPRSLRRIEQDDLPMGLTLDFIFSAAAYFHIPPDRLFFPLL